MRRIVFAGELAGGTRESVWAPARQDARSTQGNTEAVDGAEWIHIHHRTSDMTVTGKKARPCCVELVCHACHQSAIVLFRVDLTRNPPETVRGDEVAKVGLEFMHAHKSCKPDKGRDYRLVCDERRSGEPKTFDFAGVLG